MNIIKTKMFFTLLGLLLLFASVTGCDDNSADSTDSTGTVQIKNDFDNEEMDYQPPWVICELSYQGVEFGHLDIGETSEEKEVETGIDYVLMVAAWDDPTCDPDNCLPIASRNEEEVVDGQSRTISINMPNHQGPCPPEGIQPIPENLYNRILELWPDYEFLPYDQKTENTKCLD